MDAESDEELESLRAAFVETLYLALCAGEPLSWPDCPRCGGPWQADIERVALVCQRCEKNGNV